MSGTLSCTIDATGIHSPQYTDILAALVAQVRSIYGNDIYLNPDGMDYQALAIFALCHYNANSMCISVYNNFSPSFAQGVGLSSLVKLNGLARLLPSNSQVDVHIGGTVGTVITNGIVMDVSNNQWALPATVTIDATGLVTVTATCLTPGSITAAPGDISQIFTPTLGWQTVTNSSAATRGAPVETDAGLRLRQTYSTALPALSVEESITGAILSITGVTRVKNYENDTSLTDANGQPAHSIALVVDGGDAQTIANTLFLKKAPGVGTYGTTTQGVVDLFGRNNLIHFFRPTPVVISGIITIKALKNYSNLAGTEIISAVVQYITGLAIGDQVYLNRLYVPISLTGKYQVATRPNDGLTYDMLSVAIARDGATPAAADIIIAFNEAVTTDFTQWTLVVN